MVCKLLCHTHPFCIPHVEFSSPLGDTDGNTVDLRGMPVQFLAVRITEICLKGQAPKILFLGSSWSGLKGVAWLALLPSLQLYILGGIKIQYWTQTKQTERGMCVL